MTSAAKRNHLGQDGFYFRIFRVFRQRTMAGFAGKAGVLALLFELHNIGMACFARGAAGKVNRMRADVLERGRPEMAVAAEAFRYHRPADYKERNH